ncbi:hypothetical protein CPB83DRAFT_919757 [Crepidotus variabilis]|uniref:Uncharacterized protein n=1 Tax=Crepidotus variabilis TaxID=179855 RepID=A0A9P6JSF0_9AGAR|nr:hypothetical protein CPB83DRAFT_919757 [Crepidotus variabilis]
MPDALSVSISQLTGMFVQASLFGILLVTFGFCLHSLFTYRGRPRQLDDVKWLMVSFTLLSFVLAVLDMCLAFYLNLKVFAILQEKDDLAKAFSTASSWISITKSALIHTQVMLGDSMLIYRCWVVWNRSFKVILLSLILWFTAISITIWFVYLEVAIGNHLVISAKQLTPTLTTFWAITITLNTITTSLLVYRIWKVELGNKSVSSARSSDRPGSLEKVIHYVIGSGLLYTLSSIMSFTTAATASNGSYITGNAVIMIVPIAFNLLIIRTSRIGVHPESATFSGSNTSDTYSLHPVIRNPRHESTDITKEGGLRLVMTQTSLVDYKLDKESA